MKIRYLGDVVLRRRAWDLAEKLGRASTFDAEYIALTPLQADALVTLDTELARLAQGIVRAASIKELQNATGEGLHPAHGVPDAGSLHGQVVSPPPEVSARHPPARRREFRRSRERLT